MTESSDRVAKTRLPSYLLGAAVRRMELPPENVALPDPQHVPQQASQSLSDAALEPVHSLRRRRHTYSGQLSSCLPVRESLVRHSAVDPGRNLTTVF
jgi:hypothetical protein